MSTVASKLNISKVGRVCVTVADTDRAIDFYVGTLGFEKVVDEPMGPDMRWVEVAISGAETTIALAPPPPGQQAGGSQTGICLDTSDVDGAHAALKAAGADVDDVHVLARDPRDIAGDDDLHHARCDLLETENSSVARPMNVAAPRGRSCRPTERTPIP